LICAHLNDVTSLV